MLVLNSILLNDSIISLRNGGILGNVVGFIINPANLKIEALRCNINNSKTPLFLLNQDIRDISTDKILINDHDSLSEADDLIRLRDILDLNFILEGKSVYTKSKEKLGKVKEFAIDNSSFYIQKLYIAQPIYKSLYGGQLIIDRTQIIEITNTKIIVNDLLQPTKLKASIISSVVGTI
jgi:uncharacterized protein YrrD